MPKQKLELKEIKTSELVVDKFNVRGDIWDNDDELVDSIKSQGVLEPLLVRSVKTQKEKYPKNKKFSIICGNRRWHGAMEARLKVIPCVIRNDIDDLNALGTSLQENLKRKNLGRIQEAEAIARMWEMLNGERTYEQRLAEMYKMFGLRESSIYNYLAISRLGVTLKKYLQHAGGKIDKETIANVATVSEWTDKEKQEAMEEISEIERPIERRKALSEMKHRAEEESPKEALASYKREVREISGETFDIYLNAKERQVTVKAARKEKLEINTLIKRNHTRWLKKEGYL